MTRLYFRVCCERQLIKYHSGDQTKKTELGRAYSTYACDESRIQDFSGETSGKETT